MMQRSSPCSSPVMPHSSSTSRSAVREISSPSSCFPFGRSHRPFLKMSRYSPSVFCTSPPPAFIGVRVLHRCVRVSSRSQGLMGMYRYFKFLFCSNKQGSSWSVLLLAECSTAAFGLYGVVMFLLQTLIILSLKYMLYIKNVK